jgi:hypothetical protein
MTENKTVSVPQEPSEQTGAKVLLPPDESLWRKYSAHHEFPLSTLASVVLHAFVILMVAMFGAILFNWRSDQEPPEVGNLIFAGGGGEGGGDPDASEDPSNQLVFDPTRRGDANPQLEYIPEDLRRPEDSAQARLIEQAQTADRKTRGINDPSLRPGSSGRGGPGSGGGRGRGIGLGEGQGSGPGKATQRARRMQRWDLSFGHDNTPEEYIRKLNNLQAILLVPGPDDQFRVYRDLTQRPLRGRIEPRAEINKLNRIYFVQDDPQHLEALIHILGLDSPPRYLAAFFPRSLEEELLRTELAHAGLTEEGIDQKKLATKFTAERREERWVVRVVEQKPRP